MATLQTYLSATQRLLHDSNAKYWTVSTLIDAINAAQKRVVGDSKCNRVLQTIYLSTGLETYSYGSVTGFLITNPGSGFTSAPLIVIDPPPAGGTQATAGATLLNGTIGDIFVIDGGSGYVTAPSVSFAIGADVYADAYADNYTGGTSGSGVAAIASILDPLTLDTLNITVLWGSTRYIMNRMSFTRFQASIRAWTGYSQVPCFCANYGQNGWYIGPIPDMSYVSEWDTIVIPNDLVNLTDVSVVQYPFSECVPYYAAHVAKYQEQSYAEADKFLELYTQKMKYGIRSIMQRMLPTAYAQG